jgi:hypothetical protein
MGFSRFVHLEEACFVREPDIIQFPQGGPDTLDRAGHDVIVKLQQAAGIAEQHAQHVLGIAHQTSMQLRVAEDKIAKLEAEIWAYKDRAERAEEWLRRITTEIEKSFPVRRQQQAQAEARPPQPEDFAPKHAATRR